MLIANPIYDKLQRANEEEQVRKTMDVEDEILEAFREKEREKIEALELLQESKKVIAEKEKALEEKDKKLEEKDKALQENQKALAEQEKLIAELLARLNKEKK